MAGRAALAAESSSCCPPEFSRQTPRAGQKTGTLAVADMHCTGIVIILPGPQVALPGSNHRADLAPPERRSARDQASPRSLSPCIRHYVADDRQAFSWMIRVPVAPDHPADAAVVRPQTTD